MEGHSQLANCVRGKTMALFKPWRYLVSKPPNLDVAKEARILCDEVNVIILYIHIDVMNLLRFCLVVHN